MTFGKTVLAIIVALILTPIVGSVVCAGGCAGCVAFVNKATRENQERMERKP